MSEHAPTSGGSNFFGHPELEAQRMDWEGGDQARIYPPQNSPLPISQTREIKLEYEISRLESEGGRVSPGD